METNKKRAINKTFFEDLQKGKLKKLLEEVKSDGTLCLEFRGENIIVIYYRGGALYTVTQKNDDYEITFNDNYRGDKDIDKAKSKNVVVSLTEAISNIGMYKHIMDKYFSKHHKYEREFQQLILRENNYTGEVTDASDYYILDIEYAYKNEIDARFDMLAVRWPSESNSRQKPNNLPISIIEVKYGDGSIDGKAGIEKHISDYLEFRKNETALKELAEDMTEVIKMKHKLGLITSYKEKQDKGINFTISIEEPEFLFLFANHDPAKNKIKDELDKCIKKYKGLDEEKYLDEIKVARASELGYGLYAYKYVNKEKLDNFPTIQQYVGK